MTKHRRIGTKRAWIFYDRRNRKFATLRRDPGGTIGFIGPFGFVVHKRVGERQETA